MLGTGAVGTQLPLGVVDELEVEVEQPAQEVDDHEQVLPPVGKSLRARLGVGQPGLFFFAADMVAALREARRVAKPASPVVIQVWGRPDHCDLTAMKPLVAPFMPPPEPGAPSPPPLWQPGVLEGIAGQAGLAPESAFDVSYAFEYSDDDAVADGILSAGGVGAAAGDREEKLRASLLEALAPYRTPSGGYRLENEWRYLVARAG
jgi:hypothetical protein